MFFIISEISARYSIFFEKMEESIMEIAVKPEKFGIA